jgi:hypothetical protein
VLTLYTTPVIYLYMARFGRLLRRKPTLTPPPEVAGAEA